MSWPSKKRGNSTCLAFMFAFDEASEDVSSVEGALSIIYEWEASNRKGYRKGTCKYEAISETAYEKISLVKNISINK